MMTKHLHISPEIKECRCGASFARPAWASDRQWAYLKVCQSCEDASIRTRIEGRVRVDERGCWIWQGSLAKMGYGQLSIHDKPYTLHRLAYKLYKGPIPEDLEVCHQCDVRACCNPEHLFLGTHQENVADMLEKGRGSKPPVLTGTAHPKATLSFDQVTEIRRLRAAGVPQRRVAKMFGVGQSTVWNIAQWRTRKSA